jgi:hypothetical protein
VFDLENKACCPFSIIVKTENELEKCLVDLEEKKKNWKKGPLLGRFLKIPF